ncbi:unnamed protein product [Caenorhabditis angaria]|uniref:Domain of unknown function DX domain-containing protein n=1 Tax=Caenorhabditis angaria TaxID=860376 RepID=A0A9P1N798_9PELO|nr:unnamed protein product [Caenorhabditis angaria]
MKYFRLFELLLSVIYVNFGLSMLDGFYKCPTTDTTYDRATCQNYPDRMLIIDWRNDALCCEKVALYCPSGMLSEFMSSYREKRILYMTALPHISAYGELRGFVYDAKDLKPKRYICAIPIGYIWYDQLFVKQESSNLKYLPYGDTGENYKKEQPKTCEKHSDCPNFDSFCGNVVNPRIEGGTCLGDRRIKCWNYADCESVRHVKKSGHFCTNALYLKQWTMMEREKKFCYKNPDIPGDTAIQQFQKRDSKLNIFLCDKDSDCDIGLEKSGICAKQKEKGAFIKWTGHVIDGSKYGKRTSYTGICLESKPISFTLSQIFIDLDVSQKNGEIGRKYLSIIWKNRDQTPQCNKNGDCRKGEEFCDNIYSLRRDLHNFDENYKFCFKLPDPSNTALSYTIIDNKIGLISCKSYEDCRTAGGDANSFCYTAEPLKYKRYENGAVKQFDGVCMSAKTCVDPSIIYEWEEGSVANSGHCEKDDDCLNGGKTKEGANINNIYEYRCKNVTSLGEIGFCCYRKTDNCPEGKVVNPNLRCGKEESNSTEAFEQCYDDDKIIVKYNIWCETEINQCCLDDDYSLCPDKQTPLFNEPKCVGSIKNNVSSGECVVKSGGICKRGHCCPNATMTGIFIKPEFSYITELSCDSGFPVHQFTAGYCDPDSKKVVIIGEKLPDGTLLKKWPEDNPRNCSFDSECSSDNSKLCLREEPTAIRFTCFYNPLKPFPRKESKDEKMIFIILIIILVVLLVVGGIGGFLLWKLKLKTKKQRKTGKNEKDGKKKEEKGKNGKKSNKKINSEFKSTSGVSGTMDSPSMI